MAKAIDPRLDLLEERRVKNIDTQVNNSALPAGASMFYYCQGCGAETAVKPEGWYQNPPPPYCDDCDTLIKDGVIDRSNTYIDWLQPRGKFAYWR